MADGMNKVFLFGNLGKEPVLRTTQNGTPFLRFQLATNESYRDKSEQWQTRTEWHTVTLWGNRATALMRFLDRGSRVMVEGSLRTSSYEKDGATRYFTEVKARDIFLVGPPPRAAEPERAAGGGCAATTSPPIGAAAVSQPA